MAFIQQRVVRFDDVDFARVVYFPRLLEYCHQTFEDFFATELGRPYSSVLQDLQIGFPAVHLEADFRLPFRFGDPCRVVLEAEGIGDKSIACRYRLFRGDADVVCAQIRIVCATISMASFKAAPVPEVVSAAFAKHLTRPDS
jgi:YbgC/YbaW family acyl-CoA thioester hydrolase